jgi:hypothetical protein
MAEEAGRSEPNDPNGMALSTVDAEGLPNVRMVLLKGYDADGFVFYTNTESQKGEELLGQGKAAALFHWKSLRRQVRIRGPVSLVSDAEADAYFQSRAARQPHRRLGLAAVAPSGEPVCAGEGGGGYAPNSASARSRARRTGPASVSNPSISNSGATAHSVCTIASSSAAPRQQSPGRARVSTPEEYPPWRCLYSISPRPRRASARSCC